MASKCWRCCGSILFFAECPNGSGHPSFDAYVARYGSDIEMKEALLDHFEVGGHKAYWVARLGRLFDIHLVSELPRRFVERCHLHPVTPQAHAARLRELIRPGSRIGLIPHAGHTLPRIAVPREAAQC